MDKNKVKSELIDFIAKKISYDGNIIQDEIKCPKCGEIVQQQALNHWIDHKQVLEGQILSFLGLKSRHIDIGNLLDGVYVSGDSRVDAKEIAEKIIEEIYQ